MLIYQEAAIEAIKVGDLVEVEVDGVNLGAKVVGCDLERGALGVVPYSYAEPSENGSSFVIARCRGEVLTVTPGEGGVRVRKAVDSEAAITHPLTWERIAELEPKVLGLLREIKAERPREGNYLWIWGTYKQRLSELVGWGRETAEHPELRSSAAYNLVYHMLLDNLRDPE
jgi:hypothetical protein